MKFVVDAFGADKGEEVVVRGCVDALNLKSDLELILVGNTDIVEPLLAACAYDKSRLEVIDAKDTITNNESPTVAIKKKNNRLWLWRAIFAARETTWTELFPPAAPVLF